MKIVALFGTDTDRVRARALDIVKGVKKKQYRVSEITPKILFPEALSESGLFEENVLYLCESAGKRAESDWEYLLENASNINTSLLLVFGETVPVKIKKQLPSDTKFEEYKIPVIIFQFLESLVPGNKQALLLLKKVTATEPIELVFSMMVTHFRDLYWVATESSSFGGPDWRKGKLESQARKFGVEKLESAFDALSQIDTDVKSSIGNLTLFVDKFLINFLVLK